MTHDPPPSSPPPAAERAIVERWLALDPDPATRSELEALFQSDPELAVARFAGRIGFGTAGLRAEMAPGPMAMNRLVVRQTTLGLARWLSRRSRTTRSDGPKVVVGYDARHNSADFARDVAAVIAGAGGTGELIARPVPTPVLAHAVLDRSADAGVMITASHNPPADNGYKLYLDDGIQLVDPADGEIAAEIDRVAAEMADPTVSVDEARSIIPLAGEDVVELGDECTARYLDAAVHACVGTERGVRVLYTAMHGVGGQHLLAAFEAAGFPTPDVVPEQFDPNPDFPTVPFPNPEEEGALDLALGAAAAADRDGDPYDVVLANDPDADRLAVAVPDRTGRWRRLTGDQVGVLLADHLLASTQGPDRLVASSLVSSRLISAMAASAGVVDVRTLTGFKWIARPIVDRPDHRFLLGYEEAIGYCVGDRVRDKDGISAALAFAELAAGAKLTSESLDDRLDRLAVAHGLHLTRPVTLAFRGPDGAAERSAVMAGVRATPPGEIGGLKVVASEDLAAGGDLPPTDGLVWHLADRSRVVVRPSGTEPKLKAYLEVIEPVSDATATGISTARAAAGLRLDALATGVEALLIG